VAYKASWAASITKILPDFKMPKREIGIIPDFSLGVESKPGPGRGKKTSSDTTRLIGRGSTYTVARLNRDNPDLADKVKAGEMKA